MNIENLPKKMEFYHLGPVAQDRVIDVIPSDLCEIHRFFLYESKCLNSRDLLIVGIPNGKNISKYSELGNILASRTFEKMISPPKEVTRSTLDFLNASATFKLGLEFIHTETTGVTLLPVFLYTCAEVRREIGNA